MAEKKVERVEVGETGHKQWQRDYTLSDVEVLYRRGHWSSWGDVIHWLETKGEQDNELTPGEVVAMKEDIQRLQQSGTPFTSDPHRAFEMAHQYRQKKAA